MPELLDLASVGCLREVLTMKVHFSKFTDSDSLRAVLEQDGWKLVSRGHDICATHRQVPDEVSARYRLNQLGLLISSSLRIRFQNYPKEGTGNFSELRNETSGR
jgi:hypothetical protein